MAEENEEGGQDDIVVKHTYADSYRLHPATGVAGGMQPQGDLKIDFVYDHGFETSSERYDSEDRFLTGITMDSHMKREHQVGISLNPEDAYHSAVWILSQLVGESITRQDIHDAISDLREESET